MIFDLIETLIKMVFTIILLMLMAIITPLFFLFLTPKKVFKNILLPIVGAMIVMGYNKDMLLTDITFDVKEF